MIRHMVALDRRRGIARQGRQPWKLPTDEHYFAAQTKLHGGVMLMGRKTYVVIGRPLPERQNFVLTRDMSFEAPGITVVHDIDAFLAAHDDVWVIGGGEIFAATMGRVDELYITEIDADYDCDTFYPAYDDFEAVQTGDWQTENETRFRFMIYRQKPR